MPYSGLVRPELDVVMTRHFGTYEAKTKLSELLDLVEKGEEVVITRHGKPVAKLVVADDPIGEEKRRKAREAIEGMRKFRASLPKDVLKGTSIKELIEEGRK